MSEHDEQWFDALAGHSSPANAQDQRLQQALRQAARIDAAAQPDQLAERRLLDRLEREGLLVTAREPQPARRTIRPRLAQVAVIVLCLGLLVELSFMPAQESGEERMQFSPKDVPDRAVPAAAAAPKVEAAAESLGSTRSPQPLMQRQRSMAKPAAAESPSVALADQAASTVSRLGNTASRAAKFPLAKREEEQEQVAALWVEDAAQAWQQLHAWRLPEEADAAKQRDGADGGLVQLRCEQEAACKELAAVLHVLSIRPLSATPSVGKILQLRLRQAP